jgi:hypothetical protein
MSGQDAARAAAGSGALLIALALSGASPAGLPADDPKPVAKDAFGPTKVWTVHLVISAKEFEAMQPAPGGFGGGPFGPPRKKDARKDEKKDDKKRDSEKNQFGTDFPWVEADATVEGKSIKKVGVRYAGDITYFVSARGLKRPLAIQFDKFNDQQLVGGRAA